MIALAVFAFCVTALGYLHRDDLFPATPVDTMALANPAFLDCRKKRVGHINTMLQQGIVDQTRHAQFKERAIAYCAAQFPPGQPVK